MVPRGTLISKLTPSKSKYLKHKDYNIRNFGEGKYLVLRGEGGGEGKIGKNLLSKKKGRIDVKYA